MKRIYIYSVLYIITLLSFLFFNNISGVDTIVFFVFLLASLYLVFTREELPKAKYLKILEVKQYQEKRINIYGYVMSIVLIVGSLLFTSLTIFFRLNLGISSLIIWPMLIITFLISTNYLADISYSTNIFNYLKSENKILSDIQLRSITNFLIKNTEKPIQQDKLEDLFLQKFSSNISIPTLHETIENFLEYKMAEANTISPDEISEINEI